MNQLAIFGGTPQRTVPFPSWPAFDENEEQALLEVLRSGQWWRYSYGEAVEAKAPEGVHGKHPRLFYGTQIAVAPPTFLVFASHPQLISAQYTRYLANTFRRHLPFPSCPGLRTVPAPADCQP